jgi:8-oxo-dGTP pyrophosphatase MutT (NUDIX family)
VPNKKVISAGGVIYRKSEKGDVEIYLCQHKKLGWVLPKGKTENGETIIQTAEREVEEETGFKLIAGSNLGKLSYTFELNNELLDKEVHFFSFEFLEQEQNYKVFDREINITPGKWFLASEAIKVIEHYTEGDICSKLLQSLK